MKNLPASGRFLRLLPAGLLWLPVLLFAADQPPPEKKEEPRTHVLYMGANLDIKQEKKFYRVEDVVGSEFMIRVNKKEVYIPTRQRTTGLKVNYDLKISGMNVQLDGLEAGPAYTPANDPKLKFDRASGAAGGAEAVQDLAYGAMFQADFAAAAATAGGPPGGAGADAAAAGAAALRADQEMAFSRLDPSNQSMWQSQYNTGEQADIMQKELAEGNYDAMEVSFKISSPVELDDPYMVILFKFRERDALPGNEGMLIYAKAIDPIGPKPKYIRVREGGLPAGFKYVDAQVHIYNHGQEVATNASTNRVELTRDEVRQYILIEHIGANQKNTVPASAVRGTLPRARRAELSTDQMNRTAYVKVSKDAEVLGIFQDEACQLALEDERYLAVVGDVFFRPALYEGKPVEGVARLRLGDI